MYHSVYIDTSTSDAFSLSNSVNTYDDWFLVSDSRPTITNPKLKTNYIDVPGASGSIDASAWLAGFPTYSDREGELKFYVLNDHGIWTDRRNAINAAVHGKKIKLLLEDELDYYYKGRMQVDDWASEANWSQITLKYRLEPFKYAMNGSSSWIWDPFNFNNGIILDSHYSNIESGTIRYISMSSLPVQPSYGSVTITGATGNGATLRFVNDELGIDITKTLPNGTTKVYELLFSNLSGNNLVSVRVDGGTASFDVIFRSI